MHWLIVTSQLPEALLFISNKYYDTSTRDKLIFNLLSLEDSIIDIMSDEGRLCFIKIFQQLECKKGELSFRQYCLLRSNCTCSFEWNSLAKELFCNGYYNNASVAVTRAIKYHQNGSDGVLLSELYSLKYEAVKCSQTASSCAVTALGVIALEFRLQER